MAVTVGEVLAIERQDIDMKNNIIHINKTLTKDKHDRPIISHSTKTKAGMRDIPLNEHLKQLVKKNTNFKYLFTLPDGRLISTSTINSHIRKIGKDSQIRTCIRERKGKNHSIIRENTSYLTTHVLRHTFITRMVEEGINQKILQTIVGHSDYRITADIYTQIDDKFKNDEMLKTQERLRACNLI